MMRTSVLAIVLLLGLVCAQERSISGGGSRKFSASKSQAVNFNCPEDFGYYAHPSDCTQYYVCVFGGALMESCTGGLMYSNDLQTCDWPRNVVCNPSGGPGLSTVKITDSRTRGRETNRIHSATESLSASESLIDRGIDNTIRGRQPLKSSGSSKSIFDDSKLRQGRFINNQNSNPQRIDNGFQAQETSSRSFNVVPASPTPKSRFSFPPSLPGTNNRFVPARASTPKPAAESFFGDVKLNNTDDYYYYYDDLLFDDYFEPNAAQQGKVTPKPIVRTPSRSRKKPEGKKFTSPSVVTSDVNSKRRGSSRSSSSQFPTTSSLTSSRVSSRSSFSSSPSSSLPSKVTSRSGSSGSRGGPFSASQDARTPQRTSSRNTPSRLATSGHPLSNPKTGSPSTKPPPSSHTSTTTISTTKTPTTNTSRTNPLKSTSSDHSSVSDALASSSELIHSTVPLPTKPRKASAINEASSRDRDKDNEIVKRLAISDPEVEDDVNNEVEEKNQTKKNRRNSFPIATITVALMKERQRLSNSNLSFPKFERSKIPISSNSRSILSSATRGSSRRSDNPFLLASNRRRSSASPSSILRNKSSARFRKDNDNHSPKAESSSQVISKRLPQRPLPKTLLPDRKTDIFSNRGSIAEKRINLSYNPRAFEPSPRIAIPRSGTRNTEPNVKKKIPSPVLLEGPPKIEEADALRRRPTLKPSTVSLKPKIPSARIIKPPVPQRIHMRVNSPTENPNKNRQTFIQSFNREREIPAVTVNTNRQAPSHLLNRNVNSPNENFNRNRPIPVKSFDRSRETSTKMPSRSRSFSTETPHKNIPFSPQRPIENISPFRNRQYPTEQRNTDRRFSTESPYKNRPLSTERPNTNRHPSTKIPNSNRDLSTENLNKNRQLSTEAPFRNRHLPTQRPNAKRHPSVESPHKSTQSSTERPNVSREPSTESLNKNKYLSTEKSITNKHSSTESSVQSRPFSTESYHRNRQPSTENSNKNRHPLIKNLNRSRQFATKTLNRNREAAIKTPNQNRQTTAETSNQNRQWIKGNRFLKPISKTAVSSTTPHPLTTTTTLKTTTTISFASELPEESINLIDSTERQEATKGRRNEYEDNPSISSKIKTFNNSKQDHTPSTTEKNVPEVKKALESSTSKPRRPIRPMFPSASASTPRTDDSNNEPKSVSFSLERKTQTYQPATITFAQLRSSSLKPSSLLNTSSFKNKNQSIIQDSNTSSTRAFKPDTPPRPTFPSPLKPILNKPSTPKFPERKDLNETSSNPSQETGLDRGPSRPKPKASSSKASTSGGSPKVVGRTPQRLVRPSKKPLPASSRSSQINDIWKYPPRRPAPLYKQPPADVPAQKCDRTVCKLPDCSCGGPEIPGNIPAQNVPQMVLLTFDDSVNDLNKKLYIELFERGRVNPNGCPISATFYISHEWTDYSQVQNLYSDGHEIASHSITHSFGEQFTESKWAKEIGGQREIMSAYGGVRMDDIRGMRAPFLAVGGNNMFRMLYDLNFTYDSSMPVYANNPPSWPYTLDYKIFHDCMIPPCPTNSYPGVWQVPMVMWQDLVGGRCSMGDACTTPPDAEGVYQMLVKNFERHYTTSRSPMGLFYHAAWFTTPHHQEGFIAFLDTIAAMDDVWLVTNWQALQWVRDPVPLSQAKSFKPFQCDYPERPPRCTSPKVCNVWHKGSVRYMKTCQTCPESYPWTGKTGVQSPLNDI